MLRAILGNVSDFFGRVLTIESRLQKGHIRGWGNVPFIFLQTTSKEEDDAEHAIRLGLEPYGTRFANLPPEVHYAPTIGNFSKRLVNAKRGKLVIEPLQGFSSLGFRDWPYLAHALGYRLPHMPTVFGINAETASFCLARTIVHDIGHYFLPPVAEGIEALHNAIMINASRTHNPIVSCHTWDQVVFQESTNEFFPVRETSQFERSRSTYLSSLSPAQRFLCERFEQLYLHPNRDMRSKQLWGMGIDADPADRVFAIIQKMRATIENGFEDYLKPTSTTA